MGEGEAAQEGRQQPGEHPQEGDGQVVEQRVAAPQRGQPAGGTAARTSLWGGGGWLGVN